MAHSINWINDSAEKNLETIGRKSLERKISDLEKYLNIGSFDISGLLEIDLSEELKEQINTEVQENELQLDDDFDSLSDSLQDEIREYLSEDFSNYGLSFDYVEIDENIDQDYFRYQLSWGGPSDEIRFYENGAIEYVYMDWYCGIGFNVNTDSTFKLLFDYFTDLGMLDFEAKRGEYDYYSILAEKEAED